MRGDNPDTTPLHRGHSALLFLMAIDSIKEPPSIAVPTASVVTRLVRGQGCFWLRRDRTHPCRPDPKYIGSTRTTLDSSETDAYPKLDILQKFLAVCMYSTRRTGNTPPRRRAPKASISYSLYAANRIPIGLRRRSKSKFQKPLSLLMPHCCLGYAIVKVPNGMDPGMIDYPPRVEDGQTIELSTHDPTVTFYKFLWGIRARAQRLSLFGGRTIFTTTSLLSIPVDMR
jgi:hypothetical protein